MENQQYTNQEKTSDNISKLFNPENAYKKQQKEILKDEDYKKRFG
jgi:hypothetical protein